MQTEILKPSISAYKKAKEIILDGGLVAFGTETVYGLGANAFNTYAVKSIFEVKGRPNDNPLIVHLPKAGDIKNVAVITSEMSAKLFKILPSPLTLVLPKADGIPYEVTAGLETVAVRIPAHEKAREFLEYCGVPIAAPSANTSSRPSPTQACHVFEDLHGKIPLILDFGQSEIGLESTVLDLTVFPYRILRSGGFTYEMLCEFFDGNIMDDGASGAIPKSPGMKYKHYSPSVPVRLYKPDEELLLLRDLNKLSANRKTALMALSKYKPLVSGNPQIIFYNLGQTKESAASKLFDAMRYLEKHCDIIYTLEMENDGIGAAFNNRIRKAAAE